MVERRYVLILGKHPIIEAKQGKYGWNLTIEIQDKLFLRTTAPHEADIRVGDLLTLYTEVLRKESH